MTAKGKERALASVAGVLAIVILWLLLRARPAAAGASAGLVPDPIGPITINGSTVPGSTLNYTPGNYSFLFPQNSTPHDDCSCGCDPADEALTGVVQDNLNAFAQGLNDAEKTYLQGVYGDLPDWMAQYINNGDSGAQLSYPPEPSNAPGQLVFQPWSDSQKADFHDKNIAGQGFWIDPASGAIVGTGTPASDGTADNKNDITPYGQETAAALSGFNMTGFQLQNGSHINDVALTNPSAWG